MGLLRVLCACRWGRSSAGGDEGTGTTCSAHVAAVLTLMEGSRGWPRHRKANFGPT